MTNSNEELLAKIATLKETAQNYTAMLADQQLRERVIDEKLSELGTQLSDALGTLDWQALGDAIAQAATRAQEAVQTLTEALDDAGVEYS